MAKVCLKGVHIPSEIKVHRSPDSGVYHFCCFFVVPRLRVLTIQYKFLMKLNARLTVALDRHICKKFLTSCFGSADHLFVCCCRSKRLSSLNYWTLHNMQLQHLKNCQSLPQYVLYLLLESIHMVNSTGWGEFHTQIVLDSRCQLTNFELAT